VAGAHRQSQLAGISKTGTREPEAFSIRKETVRKVSSSPTEQQELTIADVHAGLTI